MNSKMEVSGTLVHTGGEPSGLLIQCADGALLKVLNVSPSLLGSMSALLYKRLHRPWSRCVGAGHDPHL